jgi:hypothetical protein
MFLLPSVALGVLFAVLLGGRPSRVVEIELRHQWSVFLALGVQLFMFSSSADALPEGLHDPLHLASYGLLVIFAAANVRTLALLPLLLGMASNAAAILANGGRMPVSPGAWQAAGFEREGGGNVLVGGEHLRFLGDIFALPQEFPFSNVFSVGDVVLGFGTMAFIVAVATDDGTERRLSIARLLKPLHESSFRRLAVGKLVSHVGDWLTIAALVGWVYERTASTGQVAVLMLVRLAPPILGGGLAAALVDRLPKDRLLVWIEAARGVAVAGALAGVLADSRPVAFAAVAISGALAAVASATVRALVPSLLDEERLPAANAGLGVAQDGAMALGALGAGIALSASTASAALAVDLLTFAVAVTIYWGIRIAPLAGVGETGDGLLAGLRYLLGRRVLVAVVIAFASATLATGLVNATLPRFLGTELGLGSGAYGYGIAALAGGLTCGQALVGVARVGRGGVRWIGAGLLVMSGFLVALAFTVHAPTALLFLGLVGLVDGTTDVLFDTIVQREADPRYYGRVFGFASAFMTTTMMSAVATAPVLNRLLAPHAVISLAGLALAAAACFALVATRGAVSAPARAAEIGSSP